MKRLCIIVAAIAVAMGAQAQEKQFKAALGGGKNADAYYVISDPKGKPIKLKKLQEYAAAQGYLVGKLNYTNDKHDAVTQFPFLPKDEYVPYIYSNLREDSREYSDLAQKGTAYLYLPDDQTKVYFWRSYQTIWSGQVSGGLITGYGSGFSQIKSNAVVYFKGQFENGLPVGEVKYKWYTIKDQQPFNKAGVTTLTANVGKMNDGLASFLDNKRYGFIDAQGLAVLEPRFKSVLSDFADGKASVVQYDDQRKGYVEAIIDRTGKVVDYTDKQKGIFAQEQRAKEEAQRQAAIAAREKAVADSLAAVVAAEKARVAEEERIAAEKRKAEEAKALIAAKKNCVGRRIRWTEKITYDTSGGGFGGLLTKAIGLGTTSYTVEYTAMVESIIGESAAKAIITNAQIKDPNWASANYFKYKSYAREEASKNIGQTRVKEFSEFDLVR